MLQGHCPPPPLPAVCTAPAGAPHTCLLGVVVTALPHLAAPAGLASSCPCPWHVSQSRPCCPDSIGPRGSAPVCAPAPAVGLAPHLPLSPLLLPVGLSRLVLITDPVSALGEGEPPRLPPRQAGAPRRRRPRQPPSAAQRQGRGRRRRLDRILAAGGGECPVSAHLRPPRPRLQKAHLSRAQGVVGREVPPCTMGSCTLAPRPACARPAPASPRLFLCKPCLCEQHLCSVHTPTLMPPQPAVFAPW